MPALGEYLHLAAGQQIDRLFTSALKYYDAAYILGGLDGSQSTRSTAVVASPTGFPIVLELKSISGRTRPLVELVSSPRSRLDVLITRPDSRAIEGKVLMLRLKSEPAALDGEIIGYQSFYQGELVGDPHGSYSIKDPAPIDTGHISRVVETYPLDDAQASVSAQTVSLISQRRELEALCAQYSLPLNIPNPRDPSTLFNNLNAQTVRLARAIKAQELDYHQTETLVALLPQMRQAAVNLPGLARTFNIAGGLSAAVSVALGVLVSELTGMRESVVVTALGSQLVLELVISQLLCLPQTEKLANLHLPLVSRSSELSRSN